MCLDGAVQAQRLSCFVLVIGRRGSAVHMPIGPILNGPGHRAFEAGELADADDDVVDVEAGPLPGVEVYRAVGLHQEVLPIDRAIAIEVTGEAKRAQAYGGPAGVASGEGEITAAYA